MKIVLIRHGKTKGNLEGRYVGRTDEPMLEASRETLRKSEYGNFCPDIVYTSRLIRCVQTAEICSPGKKYNSGTDCRRRTLENLNIKIMRN